MYSAIGSDLHVNYPTLGYDLEPQGLVSIRNIAPNVLLIALNQRTVYINRKGCCVMARPRLLPSDAELTKMVEKGMSHQEIRDEIERAYHVNVSRSTVSVAIMRAGLSEEGHRYKDTVPWKVRTGHATEYPVRMLRLLGRDKSGQPLDRNEQKRLASWLEMLERERVVVAYCPDSEGEGFHYVDEKYRQGPNADIPIRVKILLPEEIA